MQIGSEKHSPLFTIAIRRSNSIILVIWKTRNSPKRYYWSRTSKVWKMLMPPIPGKGRFYTWLLNSPKQCYRQNQSKSCKNTSKNLSADNFVHVLGGTDDLSLKLTLLELKVGWKIKTNVHSTVDLLYFARGTPKYETAEAMDTPLGTIKTHCKKLHQWTA